MNSEVLPQIRAVVSYFPLPQDSGDPVRVLMVLKALEQVGHLTVAAVARPTTTDHEITELRKTLASSDVRVFAANPLGRPGPVGMPLRWSRATIMGVPPWIRSRYSSSLEAFLEQTPEPDLTVLIGEGAGVYLERRRPGHWHWDKANVMTASAKTEQPTDLPSTIRARLMENLSYRFEHSVLRHVQTISVTSPDEAGRLWEAFKLKPDFVLPSATPAAERLSKVAFDSPQVLWLSSLSYDCNWEGLARFLESGMPILRQAGLKLRVVGSGATQRQTDLLQSIEGVDYRGYVDNFAEACDGVRAAVVPIWSGAGVKLKTITLMQHGVPVFATGQAMEGVPAALAVAVDDDPAALASAIASSPPAALSEARDRALDYVIENLSEKTFIQTAARHFSALLQTRGKACSS